LPRAVDISLRVRYAETDKMGVVYHAHYLVWFEIGRTEYCRAAGIPYRRMEEEGIFIPVTAAECTYRRPARYDDTVTIRTRLGNAGSRGLSFFYEASAADDGRLLATGSTRHIFTGEAGRPITIPERIRAAFARFAEGPTSDQAG
jgi:acyl-CoA thioester hydrolase